jgi:hypothetical protein
MNLVLQPDGDYYVIDQSTTTMTGGSYPDVMHTVEAFTSNISNFNYSERDNLQYYVEEKFVYKSDGTLDGVIIATFSSLEDLTANYPELLI